MGDSPIEGFRSPSALRFQRRVVRVQRGGWILMGLVVAASLAGLFGGGPLSEASVRSDDGRLDVTFDRFLRNGTSTALSVQLMRADSESGRRLRLPDAYLSTFTIEYVRPQPERVVGAGTFTEYVFAPPADGESLAVTFGLRSEQFGSRSGSIETDEGSRVSFRQVIYP